MSHPFVLQNLTEAAEHLDAAISAAKAGNKSLCESWMPWVYRKLNAAWNSRDLPENEAMNANTYEVRCQLPADLDEFFEA
jgi:hypothetical protein